MNRRQSIAAVSALFLFVLCGGIISAEVRTITATGEYRLGDNDTRTDAKRLALLDAKRLALEKAGTHVESITEVRNLNLTKEEIRAYTAGIVEVIEQATGDTMEGAMHIVRADVKVKIDTNVVATQIDSLRKNEGAKAEILRLRAETEDLYQELAKFKVKESSSSPETADEVLHRRGEMINKAEANTLLSQAWSVLTALEVPRPEEALSVWQQASEAIKVAERVIVIGYSLPPADAPTRTTLSLALRQNESLKTVSVVLPKPDSKDDAHARWREFCSSARKSVQPIYKKFEEYVLGI